MRERLLKVVHERLKHEHDTVRLELGQNNLRQSQTIVKLRPAMLFITALLWKLYGKPLDTFLP